MWREFLTLSRREQLGLIALFILLMVVILLLFLKPKYKPSEIDKDLLLWTPKVQEANDSLNQVSLIRKSFKFNPNTVSKEELLQLGFSSQASHNLIKYREAGGKVYNFEKMSRIYGMDSLHLDSLRSFIVFDTKQTNDLTRYPRNKYSYKIDLNTIDSIALFELNMKEQVYHEIRSLKKNFYFKRRIDRDSLLQINLEEWNELKQQLLLPKSNELTQNNEFVIELNTADTAELVLLKGIGRVFAKRIVYYRKKLGGYYSINQLLEVEGVSPVVISDNKEHIAIDTSLITRININTSSLKRMKEHPYMNFYMAKDIYEARKQKYPLQIDEVLKSESFGEANLDLLRLYFCDK